VLPQACDTLQLPDNLEELGEAHLQIIIQQAGLQLPPKASQTQLLALLRRARLAET